MARSSGFSAAESPFGAITGLTPKSTDNGMSESLAEAHDQNGDTVASDAHSKVIAPSCEYAVTGNVTLSSIALGKIFSYDSKKIMLTQVQVNTSAGGEPTVSLSGVECESGATDVRTCALSGSITPRTKTQDPANAFSANTKITQLNTTWSVEPHVVMVGGSPVASDCSNAKVEAQATMTDYDDAGSFTAGSGFTLTADAGVSAPDVDYVTKTATSTKFLALSTPTQSI